MSIFTMRFAGIFRTHPLPAQEIFSLRNGFKVVGIAASAIATQVIEYPPILDRAAQEFPDKTMKKGLLIVKRDQDVPIVLRRIAGISPTA